MVIDAFNLKNYIHRWHECKRIWKTHNRLSTWTNMSENSKLPTLYELSRGTISYTTSTDLLPPLSWTTVLSFSISKILWSRCILLYEGLCSRRSYCYLWFSSCQVGSGWHIGPYFTLCRIDRVLEEIVYSSWSSINWLNITINNVGCELKSMRMHQLAHLLLE